MIIASRNFRDEEYFIPLEIFEKAAAQVVTASSKAGPVLGVLGGEAEAALDIKDVKAENFDAAVFIGGDGAQEYFESSEAHRIAREFNDAGKIVAAICIAPVILAKSGILKNKTATVWQSAMDKIGPKALTEGRCAVSQNTVEKCGNIITANGKEAAEKFAKVIMEKLSKNSS